MKWFNEYYGAYLFGIYLLLNVLDWLTGWYKARVKKEANSKSGMKGIVKKVGYWVILLIAFLIPYMFQRLGKDMTYLFVKSSVALNFTRTGTRSTGF